MRNTASSRSPERANLEESIDRLLKDARDAQSAARALRRASPSGVDHTFAQEIGQLLSALQLDVAMARAEWAVHCAKTTHDLGSALDEVAHVAEIWLDDSAVQEGLNSANGQADTVVGWIEGVSSESRRTASRVASAAEHDISEMRRITLRAIHSVRVALDRAIVSLRHHP